MLTMPETIAITEAINVSAGCHDVMLINANVPDTMLNVPLVLLSCIIFNAFNAMIFIN